MVQSFSREVSRRLDALDLMDPQGLADLFVLASRKNTASKELLGALHSALLSRTIRHARKHVTWYQDRPEYLEWSPKAPDTQANLNQLPILSRRMITEQPSAFVADDVELCSMCHTSGTTTGTPLEIRKSYQELNFLNAYFLRLLSRGTDEALKPLTLSFPNFYHGTAVPLPGLGMTLVGGVTDDLLMRDAVRSLSSTYDFPGYQSRVSFVSGLVNHVLLLTNYLLEQNVDPSQFHLQGITIAGGVAAPHWRDFLRTIWNCVVTDRFSLTETIGGASRCQKCHKFHLDTHLLGEVLDIDSNQPIMEGVGRLILTNIYPFVQMQPLIRYDPADLVYRHQSDCANTLTFEFLGKSKNTILLNIDGRTEYLLFPASLNDILTNIPDVRKFEWAPNIYGLRDRSMGGLPLVEVSADMNGRQSIIRLVIELLYAPHFYRERTEELGLRIIESLSNVKGTSLGLRMARKDVALDVKFVSPGTLTEPDLKI